MGYSQIIHEPTRLTPTTSSVLDHVIVSVNSISSLTEYGVINVGFSDYLIVYCSKGSSSISTGPPITKSVRSFCDYNPQKLKRELFKLDWSNAIRSTDDNYCLEEFKRLFDSAVDVVLDL